jgi:hypothetical protein
MNAEELATCEHNQQNHKNGLYTPLREERRAIRQGGYGELPANARNDSWKQISGPVPPEDGTSGLIPAERNIKRKVEVEASQGPRKES